MARPGGRGNGGRRSRGLGAGRTGRRLDCVDADDGSSGDRVARAAILAEAGGPPGGFARDPPRKTAAPEGGRVVRREGVARRSARYSAMSVAAFAGRAGAVPVACDCVLRSIFGGGDSCSTSLVVVHSSTTFAGLSFSFVP
ncbi:hypothetical protein BCO9919_05456 [Burkholderia cenocepacia]|uniref:Uncharacterized protein n=1 Tax=Burkholderia cenocepacia TaxID=95486 RepID=A0A6J5JL14_9BURK|nr:hypothetical protein BCO9919_05456 [Burkholderia cenocepacia]